MAILPRPVRPSRAWADLRGLWAQRPRHQFRFVALAILFTGGVMWMVAEEFAATKEYIPPTPVYVKQWAADRSVEEVRAQQARDAPAELAARRAREEAAAKRRAEFKRLADKMGIE